MKKYKVMWYDQTEIKKVEPNYIEAENQEEATRKAFMMYEGNPPAPLLYLEEVKQMLDTVQGFLIAVTAITVAILLIGFVYFNFYLIQYKKKTATLDFESLIAILTATIKTELDLYEKDIFRSKGAITNSNFDNYYNDLCHRIISNLSKSFINQITIYITYDAVVTYIARSVKMYLTDKINGTM